jgi:hypothetical protein
MPVRPVHHRGDTKSVTKVAHTIDALLRRSLQYSIGRIQETLQAQLVTFPRPHEATISCSLFRRRIINPTSDHPAAVFTPCTLDDAT